MKISTKKAMATLALGLGLAATGATVAASSAPVKVGKIVPVNLVADNSTSGYVVSASLRLGDCDAYSCSCLCGVRG